MTKTSEFHTLLRNYRGIMGNIRINKIWISFDSCFFNYYADDDEIQFNLAGQEGVITIPAVISYDKIDEEDLFEDSVAGYTATLEKIKADLWDERNKQIVFICLFFSFYYIVILCSSLRTVCTLSSSTS